MKRRVLLVLIGLDLLFIWGNSALPGQVSQAISDWVGALLAGGQPGPEGGTGLLRKIAHFSEFAALGLFSAWYWRLGGERGRHLFSLTMLGCLLAACVDESIQLLTPDRGPSLVDVWIDTFGAVTGVTALCVIQKTKNMISGGNQQ